MLSKLTFEIHARVNMGWLGKPRPLLALVESRRGRYLTVKKSQIPKKQNLASEEGDEKLE